jgi:hypothetical protein
VSDDHDHDRERDELEHGWPEDIVVRQEGAVRVFWLKAPAMQNLVDRLALVLSEHMTTGIPPILRSSEYLR